MTSVIFTAYSHKDETLRDELEVHLALLKRAGIATVFHDRRILAGQDWGNEIDAVLYESDIILLLLSPDFLASDYCFGIELQTAIELHEAGQTIVIPVVLRPCEWTEDERLVRLMALPKDAVPVTTWSNKDVALLDVAKGIRRVIESLAPKGPQIDTVLGWSPSALVGARYNRVMLGQPIQRPISAVVVLVPDQAIHGESAIVGIVVTDENGEIAKVMVTLGIEGGRFGAPIDHDEPEPGQPITYEKTGAILQKIYPDDREVALTVLAEGFPPQVVHFATCPEPDVYAWGDHRRSRE
jgi:TIR domain